MSRLIDGDALIEAIRSHYENVYCEDAVLNNFYRLAHEHVIDVVNIQPTAYDAEKVVAETDKTLQDLNVVEIISHFEADKTIQKPLENFLIAFKSEIVRIVKRGGIE